MPFTGKPFERLEAVAAPWMRPNVDTDLIIRVERCAQVPRAELGRYALETVRLRPDGSPDPDFVLNRPPFDRAGILVAGENFGCGSSREMAVWALARPQVFAVYIGLSLTGAFASGLLFQLWTQVA